jgi:60kDa lysophospholipase
MGDVAFMDRDGSASALPESRVLVIITGGTICMQPSPDGLVPMTGFLDSAMAPLPSFNDTTIKPGTVLLPFREQSA